MKNKKFCENLKTLRGNVPQGTFAALFDVKQTTYSAWENGKSEPGISKICAIAQHFGISTDDLLGVAQARPKPPTPDRTAEMKRKIEAILKEY